MHTTLKCLLLKDTAEHTRQLTGFIDQTSSLTLEATTANVKETLQVINASLPDIVFLNVRHYASLKHELQERDLSPVFICIAQDNVTHSVNAGFTQLPLNGSPISYSIFLDAVNKAMLQILTTNRPVSIHRDENYFFIKSEYRILKINYDDIIFCEGLKDYTQVYTTKKSKPIITLQNLKSFAEKLPSGNFVRIHRSYIVSINHIESITKKEVEIADKILPIGNSYRNNLLEIVKRNS